MKYRGLLTSALVLLASGTAHAAGADFPGAGLLTTVEGWINGPIVFFIGVVIIVAIAILLWMAAEASHMMHSLSRGGIALAFMVFCIAIMTLLAGAGASIVPMS